jgi:hypothetical protein
VSRSTQIRAADRRTATRGSLKGVIARLDRLTKQIKPSAEDVRSRVARMSDEELDLQLLKMVEDIAGSLDAYPTAEGLIDVLRPAPGFDSSPTLPNHAQKLWHAQQHWFRLHAPHGSPQLVRVEPDHWREGRPFGLGMVFECPCARYDPGNRDGGLLGTYENLVPQSFRSLTPRERW